MEDIEALVFDLVEWVAKEPRSHAEVMDAWRTSCPRLPVWESAVERGLVRRTTLEGRGAGVIVTAAGRQFLRDTQQTTRTRPAAVPQRDATR